MRRFAAAMLLCLFGALLPSASFVVLAASPQLLPACCRVHGTHHCMLGTPAGFSVPGSTLKPTLRTPVCPFRHDLQAITQGFAAPGSQTESGIALEVAGFHLTPKHGVFTGRHFRSVAPRGPPSLFS